MSAAGAHVCATRPELLATRARIDLATWGRDLLQDKRKGLTRVLHEVAHGVIAARQQLESAALAARQSLVLAGALDGSAAVASAAWAAGGELFVEAGRTSIMGVEVPVIESLELGRHRASRGYSLSGSSPHIDDVAERFEAELELVLQVAANELRLQRLAEEIEKASRRANALQHVVIPRLERERARIALVIAEREREELFRLRRVKARRRRRSPQAREAVSPASGQGAV